MDGVFWMGGTLMLLVVIAIKQKYKFYPWLAYLFGPLYILYLLDACFWHTS